MITKHDFIMLKACLRFRIRYAEAELEELAGLTDIVSRNRYADVRDMILDLKELEFHIDDHRIIYDHLDVIHEACHEMRDGLLADLVCSEMDPEDRSQKEKFVDDLGEVMSLVLEAY